MRKNIKNIAMTLLILVMYIMIMTSPVLAAELPRTKLQVTVSLEGTLPTKEEDFIVNLKADNMDNPMPEGTIDGSYSITVAGEDTRTFPEMTFSKVGIYRYTIWQVEGNNVDCTYDKSFYHLIVYVTNIENSDGLEATSLLYKDSETEKLEKVKFHNVYKIIKPIENNTEPNNDSVNTGDESSIIFWIILSSIGVIGILFLILSSRKKGEENN